MSKLKDLRQPGIAAAKKAKASSMEPKAESAPSATNENPDHKADFDRLLQKAAKVTKD